MLAPGSNILPGGIVVHMTVMRPRHDPVRRRNPVTQPQRIGGIVTKGNDSCSTVGLVRPRGAGFQAGHARIPAGIL